MALKPQKLLGSSVKKLRGRISFHILHHTDKGGKEAAGHTHGCAQGSLLVGQRETIWIKFGSTLVQQGQ